MIVTLTQTHRNNVFTMVVTSTADPLDLKYIVQFGEPKIDKAGVINYLDNTPAAQTFTIAGSPDLVPFYTGLPLTFKLDANLDPLAKNKTLGWGNTIATRIETAMDALRLNVLPPSPNVIERAV